MLNIPVWVWLLRVQNECVDCSHPLLDDLGRQTAGEDVVRALVDLRGGYRLLQQPVQVISCKRMVSGQGGAQEDGSDAPRPIFFPWFQPAQCSFKVNARSPVPISFVDDASGFECDHPCSMPSPHVLPTFRL